MAIIDHFDRGWSINPDGIAYIQDERSFTFTEAGELSCLDPSPPSVRSFPRSNCGSASMAMRTRRRHQGGDLRVRIQPIPHPRS